MVREKLGFPISEGMVPLRELLKRYKVCTVKFLKLEGIGHVRKLLVISKSIRFTSFPISRGIEPESWFCLRNKKLSLVKFPNIKGRVPVKRLHENVRRVKSTKLFISLRMVPERLFLWRYKLRSLVRFPQLEGMEPVSWFVWTLKWIILQTFPSSRGVVPSNSLFERSISRIWYRLAKECGRFPIILL